jgi:hypothetical protein
MGRSQAQGVLAIGADTPRSHRGRLEPRIAAAGVSAVVHVGDELRPLPVGDIEQLVDQVGIGAIADLIGEG